MLTGPMQRLLITGIACMLLVSTGFVGVTTSTRNPAQLDPDNVLLRITVESDGDAVWLIEHRIRLDTENRTEAFKALMHDIQTNPEPYRERFADRFRRVIAQAENATGRDMRLRNVTIDVSIERLQNYGVISYHFVWTNFAATDGEQIIVGDAIQSLFLTQKTALVIRWPSNYALTSVAPQPTQQRANAVVWVGPMDFDANEPHLVLTRTDGASPPTTVRNDLSAQNEGLGPLVLGLIGLLIVAIAVVAIVAYRRKFEGLTERADSGENESLMSDESRVLSLLEANDGQLKQQQIAAEFDWTDTKTSRIIGDLREQHAIETYRIGRENVVTLPDEDTI